MTTFITKLKEKIYNSKTLLYFPEKLTQNANVNSAAFGHFTYRNPSTYACRWDFCLKCKV